MTDIKIEIHNLKKPRMEFKYSGSLEAAVLLCPALGMKTICFFCKRFFLFATYGVVPKFNK